MSQFCIKCGIENESQAKFCKSCGEKLARSEYDSFDKNVKNSNTSSTISNTGSKALKVIFALILAVVILSISAAIFQGLKMGTADLGQSIYENYGKVGIFFFSMAKLLPLMIGIWLVKISWKKITR